MASIPHFAHPFQRTPRPLSDLGLPVNEVANPSFETGLTGWVASAAGGTVLNTWARGTTWKKNGSYGAHLVATVNTSGSINFVNATTPVGTHIPCTPGEWISARCSVDVLACTSRYVWSINWTTAAGGYISSAQNIQTALGERDVVLTAQAPDNAFKFTVTMQVSSTVGSVDMWFDSVSIVRGPVSPPYFDGDTPGYEWTGTPHASFSKVITTHLGGRIPVVEQRTPEHVANQELSVVLTPLGFREERPDFGWEWPEFATIPVDTSGLRDAFQRLVPDSDASITEWADIADAAVRHVDISQILSGEGVSYSSESTSGYGGATSGEGA